MFSSCQTNNSGFSSDLSDFLRKPRNPTLLALQYLTIEIRREKGEWSENTTDYLQVFSDSVNVIFSEFKDLKFTLENDTLLIHYKLKNPRRVTNYDFEFVDSQLYTDAAKVKFEGEVKKMDNKNVFKSNEGRMSFFRVNTYFYVIHEYKGGRSKNKITTTQP